MTLKDVVVKPVTFLNAHVLGRFSNRKLECLNPISEIFFTTVAPTFGVTPILTNYILWCAL